jgi:hypothetical protein
VAPKHRPHRPRRRRHRPPPTPTSTISSAAPSTTPPPAAWAESPATPASSPPPPTSPLRPGPARQTHHNTGPFPSSNPRWQLMTTPEQPARPTARRSAVTRRHHLHPRRPTPPPKASPPRGFGWDINSAFSRPRGAIFPIGSFGHTGFTGTTLWMDPDSNTYVILLANAIHPRGNPPISTLRGVKSPPRLAAKALGLDNSPRGGSASTGCPNGQFAPSANGGVAHRHRHRHPRSHRPLRRPRRSTKPQNATTAISASASSPTRPASTPKAAAPSTSSTPTLTTKSPASAHHPLLPEHGISGAQNVDTENRQRHRRRHPPPVTSASTAPKTPTSAHPRPAQRPRRRRHRPPGRRRPLLHLRVRHRLLPRSRLRRKNQSATTPRQSSSSTAPTSSVA